MEGNRWVEDYLDANSRSLFALEVFYEVFISSIRFHFGVNLNSIVFVRII